MIRSLTLSLCAALLASAAGAATVDSSAFQYRIDLPLPAGGTPDELYAFKLPDTLFAVTQDSLADLRIMDDARQAVPFDITRRTELTAVTQRVSVAVTRIGFSEPAGGNRIEVAYEQTNASITPQGLTLRTPLRNFEKSVTVEGSSDGKTWSNLVQEAVVFDASRYMDVARKDVDLPAAFCRYYRVVIHEMTDLQSSPVSEIARFTGRANSGEPLYTDRQNALENRDFRIDGIDFWRRDIAQSVARERIVTRSVTNLAIRTDEQRQQTVIRFDSGRIPVTEVVVQTEARNFSREFTLYAVLPDQRLDQPRPVLARGALRRFAFRTLNETQLTLAFRENRAPTYELVIENGDNPQLPIKGILLRGPDMQALFFATAPVGLHLLAGSSRVTAPKFDLSAIRMALDRGLMGRLLNIPSVLEGNPDWKRGSGFTFNRKAALGGALVVMVVVLGFALFKASRKLD